MSSIEWRLNNGATISLDDVAPRVGERRVCIQFSLTYHCANQTCIRQQQEIYLLDRYDNRICLFAQLLNNTCDYIYNTQIAKR